MSQGSVLIAEACIGPFQMSMVEFFNGNRLPRKTVGSEHFVVDVPDGLNSSLHRSKCSIETKVFSLVCVLFI